MNILYFILFLIFFNILFNWVRNKYGVTVERFVYTLIMMLSLISSAFQGDLVSIAILGTLLILVKQVEKISDKKNVTLYKLTLIKLHILIDKGWSNVEQAHELRTKLYKIKKTLPKKLQKEINEWELSLENNEDKEENA